MEPCVRPLLRSAKQLWPRSRSNIHATSKGGPGFHSTSIRRTDGVFPELTAQRVSTPWIEALRKKQRDGHDPTKASDTPLTPSTRDLAPRKMSDSYHRVILPLARDPWMLDTYANVNGHVRLGSLFMDLDALSGVISYKHTGESVMTVTAAVDRITIRNPLREICDLELSGQVTFATGRSSMEISMQVAKATEDGSKPKEEDVLLTCAFTMVSLDPGTKKPVRICPVQINSPEEQRLFDLGQRNYEAKKDLSKMALRKVTPNDEESDLIHSMWLQFLEYSSKSGIEKPDNVVYMDRTKIHSTQIMQPQYRNRHNFMIFGGLLLKQTFELAFSCAASFSHSRPTFLSLDPSTFENPVPVGSVLYLTATVAYTDEPPESTPALPNKDQRRDFTRVQVRVESRVRNVEHGETKPTGQFNYTFLVDKDINIMPKTYSEYMIYLDARRRAQRVTASLEEPRGTTTSPEEKRKSLTE